MGRTGSPLAEWYSAQPAISALGVVIASTKLQRLANSFVRRLRMLVFKSSRCAPRQAKGLLHSGCNKARTVARYELLKQPDKQKSSRHRDDGFHGDRVPSKRSGQPKPM